MDDRRQSEDLESQNTSSSNELALKKQIDSQYYEEDGSLTTHKQQLLDLQESSHDDEAVGIAL